jgi:hypothetical protein
MEINSIVLYNGKEYVIKWAYSNGFYEIQELKGMNHVELVHSSEVEIHSSYEKNL